MIEAVKQFVQSVIVIMLLASFLQIILPEGGMKRYAQLALGLIMVLTLLTPLMRLARTPLNIGELLGQATVRTSWEELQQKGRIWQGKNEQVLLDNYRLALTEQVKQMAESSGEVKLLGCRIQLIEDREADDFGRILQLTVDLSWSSDPVNPVTSVRPVQVGDAGGEQANPPTPAAAEKAAVLRKALANHFVLTADRVAVNIK